MIVHNQVTGITELLETLVAAINRLAAAQERIAAAEESTAQAALESLHAKEDAQNHAKHEPGRNHAARS